MSEPQDIRWKQRFQNYSKAVAQLARFIKKEDLNEMEQQGLIQCFEYTYELAWNTLKDLFQDQGETNLIGSRDTFRLAFRRELIEDGQLWMDMIKSRILTSHAYDESLAATVVAVIRESYFPAFSKLQATLAALARQAP